MDRRRYLRLRRWWPLFLLLRLAAAGLLVYGAQQGLSYIMYRSKLEVDALRNRPKPDVYLGADSVKMNVIDDQGRLAMEISGKKVTLSQDQRKATFEDAHARYFEDGRQALEIEAGQIEYDTQTEDFHITRGNAADALKITTSDGWTVSSEEVEWRRFKTGSMLAGGQRPPSFRFPQGVEVRSREGNLITASYMQADKDLQYMEFVGNFQGTIQSLRDTQFLTERQLTNVENLKTGDFENLRVSAEQVIYDKRNQVVLATSRFYDRPFRIMDFNGEIVQPAKYQPTPQQVMFSKPGANIVADHLEAHIAQKWAESFGHIVMVLPPDPTKKYGEDQALHELKQFETRIAANDIEYFWGHDYVLTKSRTIVQQEDRRAEADRITYWGDRRMVLLEGGINLVQGSGDWLTKANLVDIKNPDQARMTRGYTELTSDKAVVYLANNDVVAEGNVMIRQDNREVAADQLVYQDGIKRVTAKGNVKFRDVEGQSFLASSLVFHNENETMEMTGGSSATLRLPAKFANDINRSIAESRELPPPSEVSDPPVPDEPTRNPNANDLITMNAPPLPNNSAMTGGSGLGIPGQGPPPAINGEGGVGPFIPDKGAPLGPGIQIPPREMTLNFGGDKDASVTGEAQSKSRPTVQTPLPNTQPKLQPKVAPKPQPSNPAAQPEAQTRQLPTESNLAEGGKPRSKYQREKQREGQR